MGIEDKTSQPNLEDWLLTQAISASNAGDYEQSYLYYQRAFSLAPASVLLNYNWALTALRRGDHSQVAACASRMTDFAPEDWRTAIAQAYLTELEGEAERGWQICRNAYGRVRAIEALDEIGAFTTNVLLFACRNKIETGVSELIEQVYEVGVFPEDVLGALRKLHGHVSLSAFDYLVLIEGEFSESAFPDARRYIRSYRVLADSPEQAGQMALDFESKCGESDLAVSSVERKGREDSEVYLGVWWRLSDRVIWKDENAN